MVGQRVIVEQGEQQIRVRLGEVIVAEDKLALRVGATVTHPEHIAAMWELALARQDVPQRETPLLFQQPVELRPLSVYEEVAAG